MSPLNTFASSLNNFSLSWDFGIVLFVFIAIFLYVFTIGQKKIVYLLLSVYLALALTASAPPIENLTKGLSESELQQFLARAAVLTVGALVIFFLSAGSILRLSFRTLKKEASPLWQKGLISISASGLIISSILALLPDSYYNKLSTITQQFFLHNNAHFWWILFGIVVLVLLRRGKE